jgi:hypothetical protein
MWLFAIVFCSSIEFLHYISNPYHHHNHTTTATATATATSDPSHPENPRRLEWIMKALRCYHRAHPDFAVFAETWRTAELYVYLCVCMSISPACGSCVHVDVNVIT